MKITLSTSAQEFSYILQKYAIYKPAFTEAKPDGDIQFTLDIPYDFEGIMKCVFLIGKSCMINEWSKSLNNEQPTQDNSVYSFLEKE